MLAAAIGKAGNPDIQPGVAIVIGPGTEVIAGEGRGQAPLFKVFDSHQHQGSKEARINRELIGEIARGVIKDIGYDHSDKEFDANTCAVLTAMY